MAGIYWWVAVAGAVAVSVALGAYAIDLPEEDPAGADVMITTKSSRPGCGEMCYVPFVISVEAGKSVVWINEDSAFHSVTSGEYGAPTGLFDSGYLDPGELYEVEFEDAGAYGYFCTLHPWMAGTVQVG